MIWDVTGGNDSAESARERVVVSEQAVVDFSHLTAPEQLAAIERIEEVALVVVPESLAGAYAAIPAKGVASTVYVPDGARVRIHTGALVVGGDGIGAADDVLIITGMLLITSPVSGPVPQRIHVVGSVLAPRGSESALGPALAGGTGGVGYYPYVDGQDFKMFSGQVRLSGALLTNPVGLPDDILLVAGQTVVTGEVATVGYRQVIIAGQLAAPAASRDVLEPRVQVHGQAGWYRGDDARVFYDDVSLGPDFFRLLDGAVSLVVFGDLTISDGVTESVVREKVADISLFGDATVPSGLVGVVQALAVDAFGVIRALAGDGPGS